MTTSSADSQLGFSAPKDGVQFEVLRSPHLDHLLVMTEQAVALLNRHSLDAIDTDSAAPTTPTQQAVRSENTIDPEAARSNVRKSFDEQPDDYSQIEAA